MTPQQKLDHVRDLKKGVWLNIGDRVDMTKLMGPEYHTGVVELTPGELDERLEYATMYIIFFKFTREEKPHFRIQPFSKVFLEDEHVRKYIEVKPL